ncbi:MAG: hypothetical protein ACTHKP_14625 [Nitrososphaeraceae archaeon]
MTTNEYVLVIFPSCCNDARSAKIVSVVRKRLALKDISIRKIIYEKKYVVVEVNNLVDAMSSLSEIYGIDRIAIARKVKSQFQDLIDCIVKIGKQIVVPNCSFFIKIFVDEDAKIDFVSKDVQFIASSSLLTETVDNEAHIKIARDAKTADHLIICYVGRSMSYVFMHSEMGMGGLPFNFQRRAALSTVHNALSAASCLASLKCGLVPDICLLYHDSTELKDNAKFLGPIANRTNLRRLNIKIGRIEDVTRDKSGHNFLLNEAVAISLLTLLPGRSIVIPLNVHIHSLSFVEQTIRRIRPEEKVILAPLLFLEPVDMSNLGLLEETTKIGNFNPSAAVNRQDYRKCYDIADRLSQLVFDNLKNISFEIGPNYIHDIIDSI